MKMRLITQEGLDAGEWDAESLTLAGVECVRLGRAVHRRDAFEEVAGELMHECGWKLIPA